MGNFHSQEVLYIRARIFAEGKKIASDPRCGAPNFQNEVTVQSLLHSKGGPTQNIGLKRPDMLLQTLQNHRSKQTKSIRVETKMAIRLWSNGTFTTTGGTPKRLHANHNPARKNLLRDAQAFAPAQRTLSLAV